MNNLVNRYLGDKVRRWLFGRPHYLKRVDFMLNGEQLRDWNAEQQAQYFKD